jgi:hypothetical protein
MLAFLTLYTKIVCVVVVRSMSSLLGGRAQYGKSCWLAREVWREKADDVLRWVLGMMLKKCNSVWDGAFAIHVCFGSLFVRARCCSWCGCDDGGVVRRKP